MLDYKYPNGPKGTQLYYYYFFYKYTLDVDLYACNMIQCTPHICTPVMPLETLELLSLSPLFLRG